VSTIPEPAAAALQGYNALVFDDEFNSTSTIDMSNSQQPGFNWYVANWFGAPATNTNNITISNGVLELGGGTGEAELVSAIGNSTGGVTGTVFGAGTYFEASIQFNPAGGANATSWPAFWGESIEHIIGNAQSPGQPSGYTNFAEVDFMEYMNGLTSTQYLGTIHNWSGTYSSSTGWEYNIANYGNNTISIGSVNWSAYHTYGLLWVPQSGNTPGSVTWYFDNHAMSSIYYLGPPGSTSLPGTTTGSFTPSSPGQAATTYSVLNGQQLALSLDTASNWPMYVDWVRVFQEGSAAATVNAPVINSFSHDSATVLTLVGTAEANSTVLVYDGTTWLGTAGADANGAWTFTTGTLANGAQSFTATDTDAAGNTSAASTALVVTVDTVAPAVSSVVASGSGITVDTVAPAVSSVVASGSGITHGTGDLNAGHVVTLTVNLSEAVTVAGGTPTLTLNDGGTATYTGGSRSNALTFSYMVAAGQNTAALAVTAVNLNSATVTDAAGNAAALTAAVLAGTLQIDTAAPAAPVISSDSPASGTAVNAVTLTGTAEANSVVTLYEGTSVLGTVTATSAGAWSYTTGTLAAGSYTFTATATDAAGNVSTMSQPVDPTIGSNTYPTNNTSLTLTDTNETVILSGSNDTVNLTGGSNTIQLSGSNDSLTITGSGNSINVTGSNDSVSATGVDTVTFSGSGTVDATIGSGSTLNLADSLTGSGNDTLALTGNRGTVNLNQLAHFSGFSGISLSGSSDTLTLTNANLTVTRLSGSGDTITLGTGINTVAYTNVNQSAYGSHDTIIGFNTSQDKIDFSAINGLNSNAQHVTINFLTSTPSNIAAHSIDVVASGGTTEVYANATGSSESIKHHQEDMQINLTGVVATNSSDFILHH
jgi:hypothetical protein